MPSTFSTTLRLELPSNGEQSGIWGQTLNKDISLIEQAIAGITDIYLTGGNYTLSSFNGLEDEARSAVISCTGILSAAANVVAPSVQKTYIVTNTAGANVTIKTSTGNGVTVLNGTSSLVYCDGTDFYTAVSLNNVIGNQTISGNEAIGANVTAGGNLTVTSNVTSFNGNLTFTSNTSIVTAGVNTGAYTPPTGTTAQRPTSPIGGMSRFNTEAGTYEIFNGAVWQAITGAYAANYVLIAGGGGGGATRGGGGGGAGGMLPSTASVQPGTSYAVVIGAGGSSLTNGANSTFNASIIAIGGGAGGGQYYGANPNGLAGGSGGGGANDFAGQLTLGQAGAGTAGQGNAGFVSAAAGQQTGGGGGGAGTGGTAGAGGPVSYNGGSGLANSITGTLTFYAGGGGGGGGNNEEPGQRGLGGIGGGGNGGQSGLDPAYAGSPGTPNTGGGGGGSGGTLGTPTAGGNGGSGVFIISYPSATQRATGGTVTTYTSSGTVYWVHTFNSSGTFLA